MSRPRKPFGANPPGRLMSTMLKVLAAEMSDQQRLSRGKRYYADQAVIDIVVGHGAVTAEVQGSRREPYVVTLESDPGSGVPRRAELWVQCSCPDDSGTGDAMCKHAVAAMFALSDEVAIEPELVDRWRASRRRRAAGEPSPEPSLDTADITPLDAHRPGPIDTSVPDRDRPASVIQLPGVERAHPDPAWGGMSALLASPAGAATPTFPEVGELTHPDLPDDLVRAVLDDALDHLRLRWE